MRRGAPTGAVRGIASAIGDVVGMCERLASATSGEVQADAVAVAVSAGLGRTVSVDELVRAAAREERLELGLGTKRTGDPRSRPSIGLGRADATPAAGPAGRVHRGSLRCSLRPHEPRCRISVR